MLSMQPLSAKPPFPPSHASAPFSNAAVALRSAAPGSTALLLLWSSLLLLSAKLISLVIFFIEENGNIFGKRRSTFTIGAT
jgi:hypothetical protein